MDGRSAVAGVLSPDGGLRTVVTQRWRMKHHVKRGERLFVVPDLWVEEPVPFNSALMAHCIRMAHATVVKALAPENPCGECRACCVTLYIDDVTLPSHEKLKEAPQPKRSHTPCHQCDAEVGCLVHFNRPRVCRRFECLWLKSQKTNRIMGPEMRPDRCGVILTGPEAGDPDWLIYAHPSAHDRAALDRDPFLSHAREIEADGTRVVTVTHYHGEKIR